MQQEKIEQRRNFLHPESAAGLQQARSVPPGCPWPGPVSLPPLGKPTMTLSAGQSWFPCFSQTTQYFTKLYIFIMHHRYNFQSLKMIGIKFWTKGI